MTVTTKQAAISRVRTVMLKRAALTQDSDQRRELLRAIVVCGLHSGAGPARDSEHRAAKQAAGPVKIPFSKLIPRSRPPRTKIKTRSVRPVKAPTPVSQRPSYSPYPKKPTTGTAPTSPAKVPTSTAPTGSAKVPPAGGSSVPSPYVPASAAAVKKLKSTLFGAETSADWNAAKQTAPIMANKAYRQVKKRPWIPVVGAGLPISMYNTALHGQNNANMEVLRQRADAHKEYLLGLQQLNSLLSEQVAQMKQQQQQAADKPSLISTLKEILTPAAPIAAPLAARLMQDGVGGGGNVAEPTFLDQTREGFATGQFS